MADVPLRTRVALALQRWTGQILGIIWIPLVAFLLRIVMRYRIRNARDLRRRFRELVRADDRPLLICANHLTMIDSALVAWALGGSWWYVFNYSAVPWNLPERRNFAYNWINQAAAWLAKCIPVTRGGTRDKISGVLRRIRYVLSRGETALVFPEGGRSRTGRVQPDSATYGVGRILNAVPECRTLCVYLRGDRQESWSNVPKRGDSFSVDFELFQPESDLSGLRRARDVARQIVAHLAKMEKRHLSSGDHTGGRTVAVGEA